MLRNTYFGLIKLINLVVIGKSRNTKILFRNLFQNEHLFKLDYSMLKSILPINV